jgi:CRISPR-associated protein Csm3
MKKWEVNMHTFKLLGNILISGEFETLTGLHIGGSSDSMDIGGVDSPVIRDPRSNFPYIPGSSIKGKMRMLVEFAEGVVQPDGKPVLDPSQPIAQVFGTSADTHSNSDKIGPTRLIIRDAYPTPQTVEEWENMESDLLYTEYKGENSIDRLTSKANPRFFERVVKGSRFEFDMTYSIYNILGEKEFENFKLVIQGLKLLESSYLGGHGSRGYGKIKIHVKGVNIFSAEDYKSGKLDWKFYDTPMEIGELLVEDIIEQAKAKLTK